MSNVRMNRSALMSSLVSIARRCMFEQFLIAVIAMSIVWAFPASAGAQSSVRVIASFNIGSASPWSVNPGLVIGADGNFYGTSYYGGTTNSGTIYKVSPAGQVTVIHSFSDGSIRGDGANPEDGLTLGPNGDFYGTTFQGGTAGEGTIFSMTPAGQVTILHSFNDGSVTNDGTFPMAGLTLGNDGNFYGTCSRGGSTLGSAFSTGYGAFFQVTPAGKVTILHSFADGSVANDGGIPASRLTLEPDGTFVGTTEDSPTTGVGVVFRITTGGSETILYRFGTTANDGAPPGSPLVIAPDGTLYGTTANGGPQISDGLDNSPGYGIAYQIATSGNYSILHDFSDATNDGAYPGGLVVASDGNIYGVTSAGGSTAVGGLLGYGTIFQMSAAGGITILHSFGDGSVANDGENPVAFVQGPDGNFYGTTFASTSSQKLGVVFEMTGPPLVPVGLAAAGGNSQVVLTWTPAGGAASYDIYRGTSSGTETLYSSNATGPSFTDQHVTNGTTYFYEVSSVNTIGESLKSNEAKATPEPPVPAAPTNLSAVAGNGQVTLSWTAPSGPVTSYNIYMGTSPGGEGDTAHVTGVTGTTQIVTGLTNGTTYYFEVTAVNSAGEGPRSDEAHATPQPSAPPTPLDLTATGGPSQVLLSWDDSSGAVTYNIYRGLSPGGEGAVPYKAGISQTTFTDTGLTNATTYYYEVTAVNGGGESGRSNEANATAWTPIELPTGLEMFSLPYGYAGVSLDTLFGYSGVKLAVWSATVDQYLLTPAPPANQITLGQGYWARSPQVVSITIAGTPAPTTQNFGIPLSAGWNMIGDPFLTTVPVSGLLFGNGTETFAQATSGASPLIGSSVYSYSSSSNQYVSATSLAPEQGYWIFAFSNTDLQVPHP